MSKPQYTHDCDSCVFLGSTTNQHFSSTGEVTHYDLYFCPRCDGGSAIARYGNEGSEYASGPEFIVGRANYPADSPLVEALKRWKARAHA